MGGEEEAMRDMIEIGAEKGKSNLGGEALAQKGWKSTGRQKTGLGESEGQRLDRLSSW